MATLALATLLTILDSVAKQVEVFEAAVGVSGAEANTVGRGAANNVATAQAVADAQVQADLIPTLRGRASQVLAGVAGRSLSGAALQRALDRHYGGVGGLGAFLASQDARVHPALLRIGFQVDPAQLFCPTVVDPVGSFVVTGAGAGTYTPGSDVDTAQYGKARMRLKTSGAIGAAPLTVDVSLKTLEGDLQTRSVVVPALTGSGIEFDLGTPGVDLYVGCGGITVTGGTAGDAVRVITQIERNVAL